MEVRFRQVGKIRAGPALRMDREPAGGHSRAVEETQTDSHFTHCLCRAAPAELRDGGATLTSPSSLSCMGSPGWASQKWPLCLFVLNPSPLVSNLINSFTRNANKYMGMSLQVEGSQGCDGLTPRVLVTFRGIS